MLKHSISRTSKLFLPSKIFGATIHRLFASDRLDHHITALSYIKSCIPCFVWLIAFLSAIQFRYCAGITHALSEAAEDGHCYLPQPELIEKVIKLLTTEEHQPTEDAITNIIKDMGAREELVRERIRDDYGEKLLLCYKPTFFHTEQNLAQLISRRLRQPIAQDMPRVRGWIERFTASHKIQLSQQQQQAVEMAAYSPLMILTGGPGVGKTFTTHTIVQLWKAMGKSIALAAPTGRAAQRLSEMTRLEAKTIHRLLEFDPKKMGFKCGSDNPLPHTAIIVGCCFNA